MKKSMKKVSLFAVSGTMMMLLCSCNSKPAEWNDEWVTQDIVVPRAAEGQINIDGKIADGEWDDAQAYQLARAKDWGYGRLLPRQRAREDRTPFERGFFKVKYDDKFLYVLASMEDGDVVQTNTENQKNSFATGDIIEVFLSPAKNDAIWEIYGTPLNNCTTIFYPWGGHTPFDRQTFQGENIKLAVNVNGSVNSGDEADKGWDIEMAIPRELIEKAGEVFEPGKEWRILLCRYNYGKNLPFKQISSTPRLPRTSHILIEYYSKLKFKE